MASVNVCHSVMNEKQRWMTIHLPLTWVIVMVGVQMQFMLVKLSDSTAMDDPWMKLLVEAMPICSADNITCFIMDDKGYLIAHPNRGEAIGRGPVEQQHITRKEPLVANDILNHKQFVTKNVCNSFTDRTIQRFYKFNTSFGGILTNFVHGEHCAKYQVVSLTGTNVFVGVVNQTCDVMTAFCPCSMTDRLCFNCHRMEQTDCECPCECPLEVDLYTGQLFDEEDKIPTCAPFAEELKSLTIDRDTLDKVKPCFETKCYLRTSESDCVGILGCEWCHLETNGFSRLKEGFCTYQSKCFGGVLGARTPYSNEIIAKSTPVGPVAGAIMGCFLVLALSVYCYRYHVQRTGGPHYLTSGRETMVRMSQVDNEPDEIFHYEEISPPIDQYVVLAIFENAAAVSPYRLNPGYRRPPGGDSDHGYSTMTPHEESEHLGPPYVEPLLIGKDRYRIPTSAQSEALSSGCSRASSPLPQMLLNSKNHPQTVLSSNTIINKVPGIGSHNVLAHVQVHVVDSH